MLEVCDKQALFVHPKLNMLFSYSCIYFTHLYLFSMMEEVEEAMGYGVGCFILFPKVPDNLKTNFAEESYNPNGIVPRALAMIKSKYPEAIVCTDVALDPYSDQVR